MGLRDGNTLCALPQQLGVSVAGSQPSESRRDKNQELSLQT